mmetsp:Transcript_7251/g.9848  ORF Transcript_7251/g.9848 Transcript_7251/m.9848 type:complete len:156 (-) Transcript_7251:439-906(-)
MVSSAALCLLASSLITQILGFCIQPAFAPSSIVERHPTSLFDGVDPDAGGNENPQNAEFCLEEVAKRGADKIKQISIEERTQRAMIAEAVEDRMVVLHDKLDLILGDGRMPLAEEDREKVQGLAMQIKVLQDEYTELVTGEKSRWIQSKDDSENF